MCVLRPWLQYRGYPYTGVIRWRVGTWQTPKRVTNGWCALSCQCARKYMQAEHSRAICIETYDYRQYTRGGSIFHVHKNTNDAIDDRQLG